MIVEKWKAVSFELEEELTFENSTQVRSKHNLILGAPYLLHRDGKIEKLLRLRHVANVTTVTSPNLTKF